MKIVESPSVLFVADYLDALNWIDSIGGLSGTIARSEVNLSVIREFVERTPWLSFLAQDSATVSNTSVCLSLEANPDQVRDIINLLETEGVAFDIGAYRDAPPGLRVWCGATIEREDIVLLINWLEWAYISIVSRG